MGWMSWKRVPWPTCRPECGRHRRPTGNRWRGQLDAPAGLGHDCDEAQVSSTTVNGTLREVSSTQVARGRKYFQTWSREHLAEARAAGRKLDGMGQGNGRFSGMPVWQGMTDGRQIVSDCFGTPTHGGIEEVSGKGKRNYCSISNRFKIEALFLLRTTYDGQTQVRHRIEQALRNIVPGARLAISIPLFFYLFRQPPPLSPLASFSHSLSCSLLSDFYFSVCQ